MTHFKIFRSSAIVYIITDILKLVMNKNNFFMPTVSVIGSISGLVIIYYTGFVIIKFLEKYHNDETENN